MRSSLVTGWPLLALFLLIVSCDSAPDSTSDVLAVQPVQLSNYGPLVYDDKAQGGEHGFIGNPAKKLRARLIPNLGERQRTGNKPIGPVQGVTHFFLDHDLTTGFVHPYTASMFKRLRPQDFVLRFTRTGDDPMLGSIQYIRKHEMTDADVLGKNIGFFRQWQLSEIDLRTVDGVQQVRLAPCRSASFCGCPQTVDDSELPYTPEIPIWNQDAATGWMPVASLSKLGKYSGGTAVIIWTSLKKGPASIVFQDVHGSFATIIATATEIANRYGVDPHIGISDAGPFARKVRADGNNMLQCAPLKAIAPGGTQFGAGFGLCAKVALLLKRNACCAYLQRSFFAKDERPVIVNVAGWEIETHWKIVLRHALRNNFFGRFAKWNCIIVHAGHTAHNQAFKIGQHPAFIKVPKHAVNMIKVLVQIFQKQDFAGRVEVGIGSGEAVKHAQVSTNHRCCCGAVAVEFVCINRVV